MAVASSAWRPSKAKKDAVTSSKAASSPPCKKQKQESEGKLTIERPDRLAEQREREQRRESKAESKRHVATTIISSKAEVKRNGSSGSSDQATDTEIILSSSQDLHGFAGGDLPSCTGRLESVSGPARDDRRQHRPAACQAGDGIILPQSCITGIAASFSAAATSMSSLSPFDLHTPAMVSNGSGATMAEAMGQNSKPEDDPVVKEMLERAKGIKKAADAGRGPKGELSVLLLCQYIESALVYMEACEHVLSCGGGGNVGAGSGLENVSAAIKLSSKVTSW